MKHTMKYAAAMALTGLLVGGCEGDEAGDSVSNVTEAPKYQFEDAEDYTIIDTLGVPLTSTALTNRDDAYNDKAPYGDSPFQKTILLKFRKNLSKMHRWAQESGLFGTLDANNDGISDLEPCANRVPLWFNGCEKEDGACITAVARGCTLQKIGQGEMKARRVLDVVLPDHITIDVTERPAFPNGRPVYRVDKSNVLHYEQINDLVIAMGFLKMGGECPADESGVCNLRTLADMKHADGTVGMNKQTNDKPPVKFFPYLATPHGFGESPGYWPEYNDEGQE